MHVYTMGLLSATSLAGQKVHLFILPQPEPCRILYWTCPGDLPIIQHCCTSRLCIFYVVQIARKGTKQSTGGQSVRQLLFVIDVAQTCQLVASLVYMGMYAPSSRSNS